MHFEDGVVYAEPGIDVGRARERPAGTIARFRDRNLFFGGVQAVERDRAGDSGAAAIPRRGGAAIVVDDRG